MTTHDRHRRDELPEAKQDALKRLAYIEGHIAGIRRMVEDDQYCIDVLNQTYAVRRAIQKLESVLLEGHLHSCVIDGVQEGRTDQVMRELTDLFQMAGR